MKKAFSYMFKDSLFKKKALIFWILTFFVSFLNMLINLYSETTSNDNFPIYIYVYAFIGIFVSFLLDGYLFSCIQTLIKNKDNLILPFINFKKDMIKGLKLVCAKLIAGALFTGIFLICITLCYLIRVAGLKILSNILALVLVILLIVFISVYSLSIVITFVKTEMITSFVRFPRATQFIKENSKNYFKTLGVLIGIGFIVCISNVIFMIPLLALIGNNILTALLTAIFLSVLTSYMVYVSAYLIADIINVEDNNAE